MGVAHPHHGLVDIQPRLREATIAEAFHHVVIGGHGVEVLGPRHVRGERRDAVGKALLHEVVAEVHEVLLAHGHCHVEWTRPVALSYHLEHHEVVLVEGILALERDDHAVGDSVRCHHHAALAHRVLVDGDEDGVGRYDMEVLALGAHPVLEDVLQLERVVAELRLGLCRILLVELLDLVL